MARRNIVYKELSSNCGAARQLPEVEAESAVGVVAGARLQPVDPDPHQELVGEDGLRAVRVVEAVEGGAAEAICKILAVLANIGRYLPRYRS